MDVVHIPPMSGISREEPRHDRGYQDLLIGQGRPGEVLRNLGELDNRGQLWRTLITLLEAPTPPAGELRVARRRMRRFRYRAERRQRARLRSRRSPRRRRPLTPPEHVL